MVFSASISDDSEQRYNIKGVTGAIVSNAGAFWPYRLITKIWTQLYDQHSPSLSIETKTPVTAIHYEPKTNSKYPYILKTPRGTVRSSRVVHATNGHAGHLLPKLRGKIFPLRGTMSTQKGPLEFGRFGNERAWSFIHGSKLDSDTGIFETGLYYSNQNPHSGDIFVGGETARLDELFTADDTVISAISKENISTILPKLFERGWTVGNAPEVRKVWSGIMGFTADHLPLVGKLPVSITERGEEGGEWIAAGFNGYGMPQCWSSGEAVAKMMLGIDTSDFLPEVYLATEERLNDEERMSPEASLERLMGTMKPNDRKRDGA